MGPTDLKKCWEYGTFALRNEKEKRKKRWELFTLRTRNRSLAALNARDCRVRSVANKKRNVRIAREVRTSGSLKWAHGPQKVLEILHFGRVVRSKQPNHDPMYQKRWSVAHFHTFHCAH